MMKRRWGTRQFDEVRPFEEDARGTLGNEAEAKPRQLPNASPVPANMPYPAPGLKDARGI